MKNMRCVKFAFKWSGQTVSKHFHAVLNSVLRLHAMFLVKPQPIIESESDPRWQQFQGCLGVLDGTYIDVHVPISEKGRYRNRKGQISVNVLGVCDMNMQFVYILTGWEGSAADSKVLRNAINMENGLKIPRGKYYLCDNGYLNCEGFLTPYKGVRYHLNEWTSRRPQTYQEYFNMKHTRARNVIERTFGLLKMRWGILRSPSWYLITTANKIIMACCLIHNYIRNEMMFDPLEGGLDEYMSNQSAADSNDYTDVVDSLDTTIEWTTKRDEMALNMFNNGGNGLYWHPPRTGWRHNEVCLTNIVIEGWKSENGFKVGFQRELEKGMRRIIPNTDLVATPHINSKIHVWKKEYGALFDLLSKSGIGWNSTTSMIEVEDEGIWDSCRRADPHVKGLRYKTWPYYPQCIEIFRKDRATGENTVDPIDIINDMYKSVMDQDGDVGEWFVPISPEGPVQKDDIMSGKPVDPCLNAMPKGK
ncbi:hypothetical protein ACS0TY_022251 [Phlomoides rotata]